MPASPTSLCSYLALADACRLHGKQSRAQITLFQSNPQSKMRSQQYSSLSAKIFMPLCLLCPTRHILSSIKRGAREKLGTWVWMGLWLGPQSSMRCRLQTQPTSLLDAPFSERVRHSTASSVAIQRPEEAKRPSQKPSKALATQGCRDAKTSEYLEVKGSSGI